MLAVAAPWMGDNLSLVRDIVRRLKKISAAQFFGEEGRLFFALHWSCRMVWVVHAAWLGTSFALSLSTVSTMCEMHLVSSPPVASAASSKAAQWHFVAVAPPSPCHHCVTSASSAGRR